MKSNIDDKFIKNDRIWIKHLKNISVLANSRNINNNKSRDQFSLSISRSKDYFNDIRDNATSYNSQHNQNNFNSHTKVRLHRFKKFNSNIIQQRRIQKQNQGLVNRIVNIKRPQTQGGRKFINLSHTLTNISSSQRTKKQKKIQFQNSKMFSRLVNTVSTINRASLDRSVRELTKYKKNLHNTKYINPDYTSQVARQVQKKRVTMRHLQITSPRPYLYSYSQLPHLLKNIR